MIKRSVVPHVEHLATCGILRDIQIVRVTVVVIGIAIGIVVVGGIVCWRLLVQFQHY